MAIGAIWNDGNGYCSGHVRIFDFIGNEWTQRGVDIDGVGANDQAGAKVALSADGNTVAITSRYTSYKGKVRVFSLSPQEPIGTDEQIGNAFISSVSCVEDNFSSCYKVAHNIGRSPDDVDIDLKAEGCEDDLPDSGAIQVHDKFEGGSDFYYNISFDFDKFSDSDLVHYNNSTNPANSTGEIKFCTHITTEKIISGKVFTISSRKFDYSIKFNLTADIEATFLTNDGDTTVVTETLEKFKVEACVCSDENDCVDIDDPDPIEPNSFVNICLTSANPAMKISNLQMFLQDEASLTNYPVVNFGASTWKIVDNDLTTVTEELGTVKVSTVVIFDLFTDSESNVTASGSVLLEFVDENESKRTTSFSSFSLGLSLADIDIEEGGCKQSLFQKMMNLID